MCSDHILLQIFESVGEYKIHETALCTFTKNNTVPWVFFTFFKLYKWYQIVQNTIYMRVHISRTVAFRARYKKTLSYIIVNKLDIVFGRSKNLTLRGTPYFLISILKIFDYYTRHERLFRKANLLGET